MILFCQSSHTQHFTVCFLSYIYFNLIQTHSAINLLSKASLLLWLLLFYVDTPELEKIIQQVFFFFIFHTVHHSSIPIRENRLIPIWLRSFIFHNYSSMTVQCPSFEKLNQETDSNSIVICNVICQFLFFFCICQMDTTGDGFLLLLLLNV